MARQVKLKDVLGLEWPPKNAAAAVTLYGKSPRVELEDFITDASLSSEGYLLLNLRRDKLDFTSSVPVSEELRVSIETALNSIVSKTIHEAGDIILCVP